MSPKMETRTQRQKQTVPQGFSNLNLPDYHTLYMKYTLRWFYGYETSA